MMAFFFILTINVNRSLVSCIFHQSVLVKVRPRNFNNLAFLPQELAYIDEAQNTNLAVERVDNRGKQIRK